MADAGFFKGTSAEQDSRFANKQKKLLQQMKFPDNINVKIDMIKVNLDVIKPWITKRLQELLGIEDDVVIEFVFNQLDDKHPDPKMMQINLTGFLGGSKARLFIGELWKILTSAQLSPDGIPIELVELKKKELLKKQQEEDDRLREIRKREEESQKQIVKIDVENRTNGNSNGSNRRRSVEKTRPKIRSQQERKPVRSNDESQNDRRKSPVRKRRTPSSTSSSSEDEKIERKKEKTKKRSSPSNSPDQRIEKKSKKSKRTRSASVSSSSSSPSVIEVEKPKKSKSQSTRRRSRSRSSSNHHKKSRKHEKSSSRKHRHESKSTKSHRHDSSKKKHSKSSEHQRSLSPKKPRLESQIRVQTPPPPPNRPERIVVVEESRLPSCISIVNQVTSHDESSEVHHSSEDENEIDLRERLLREKAIKSMKRRQSSTINPPPSLSKPPITERIVYQPQ